MEDGLITTKEVGNYRIKIYYDTDSACPCESWDMAACFLWEYSDLSRLQDVCDWREVFGKYGDSRHSLIDALHKLISEYVEWKDLLNYFKKGKIDGYRMRYDNHDKMRYLEWYDNYQYTKHKGYKEIFSISPSDLYTYDYTYEFIEDLEREELIQILSNLGKDIFVKEWSTRGYCQGDYIEGIAFCTKERYTKMVSNNTSDWETQIDKLIDDEVKSIGMWMWGDVKGYVLEKKVKFVKKYEDESREDEEEEECKLIDSFKRLAKKWKKDGKRLWIYSASGTLHVMMHGDTNYNPTPEFTQYGGSNIENSITIIDGIPNDGGDW